MSKSILIIDNYDSFTDNLHHLLARIRPEYTFSIYRNHDRRVFDKKWNGLVISPGPKGPEDTGILKEFFEQVVLPRKLPVLGVCLGMQFLAWYYGLTVEPSDDARHGRTVELETTGTDLFEDISQSFKVVRYNSLAIRESAEAIESSTDLIVTARQKDTGMIMALKHKDLPFSAVQFHPESFLTEQADKMMDNYFRSYIDD